MTATIRNTTGKTATDTMQLNAGAHGSLGKLLMAGLLSYGLTTGALVASTLAASVLPAHTPLSQLSMTGTAPSHGMITGATIDMEAGMQQPMPPLPDQSYDARFHEGSVTLDDNTAFAGIDPFITGPVPKK